MTALTAIMIIKMTCNDLRAECTKANLPTTGKKADLQQRLLLHHDNGKSDNDKENNSPAAPKMQFQPADLVCPIKLELPFDPVMAEDGRVYERSAIEQHIATQGRNLKSPMTNAPMGGNLLPALQHKNTIEALIQSGVLDGDLVSKWNEKVKEKKAKEDLLKKADNGDAIAMRKVGNCYFEGTNGFKLDQGLAYAYYKKGQEAGDPTSTAMLGQSLFFGHGVGRCDKQGHMYVGLAAGNGSALASWMLANNFALGYHGFPVHKAEAIYWLRIIVHGDCAVKDLPQDALEEAQAMLVELEGSTN